MVPTMVAANPPHAARTVMVTVAALDWRLPSEAL